MFLPGRLEHTCTASVVDSRARDLLITAAHCISGSANGYVFVPGYHDGVKPLGSWTVVGAYGAPGWIVRQDQQDDFAFLVVAPRVIGGHLRQIQDVTGAYTLATAPAAGDQVTVPAYALGFDDMPVTCTTHVYYVAAFPAFNCTPYPDGTSGAPWLRHRKNGWAIVGVIGGLHQGGCHAWTSYSAPFGSADLAHRHRRSAGVGLLDLPTRHKRRLSCLKLGAPQGQAGPVPRPVVRMRTVHRLVGLRSGPA